MYAPQICYTGGPQHQHFWHKAMVSSIALLGSRVLLGEGTLSQHGSKVQVAGSFLEMQQVQETRSKHRMEGQVTADLPSQTPN